jgi:UDP-glucose/GDP-mannose dehydrogenase family, UDP binding domain
VRAFDPAGMSQAKAVLQNITYCPNAYDCAAGVDALVIVTEWEQFRALDLPRLRDLMACPVIVDLRNIYRPEEMHRHGFIYTCVGRPLAAPAGSDVASITQLLLLKNQQPESGVSPRVEEDTVVSSR